MASKILRRDHNRVNYLLGAFYISCGIGVIINLIYTLIYIEIIVLILHYSSFFFLSLSLIFLFLFVLTLKKSEFIISLKTIVLILGIFSISVIGLCLIPDGVVINDSTGWIPDWSAVFAISVLIIHDLVIIPTIIYSIKMYRQFKDSMLKKKWKYFLIGIMGYFFLFYGTTISHTLAEPIIRNIWSYVSILSLPFLYLIYSSIGKNLG